MGIFEKFRGYFGNKEKTAGSERELSPEKVKGQNLHKLRDLLKEWSNMVILTMGDSHPDDGKRILALEDRIAAFTRQAGMDEKDIEGAWLGLAKLPETYLNTFKSEYRKAEMRAMEKEANKHAQESGRKIEGRLLESLKAWKQGGQDILPEAYVKLVFDLVNELPSGDREKIDMLKRCCVKAGLNEQEDQKLFAALARHNSSRKEASPTEPEPEMASVE
jgi:hypothetical protein